MLKTAGLRGDENNGVGPCPRFGQYWDLQRLSEAQHIRRHLPIGSHVFPLACPARGQSHSVAHSSSSDGRRQRPMAGLNLFATLGHWGRKAAPILAKSSL